VYHVFGKIGVWMARAGWHGYAINGNDEVLCARIFIWEWVGYRKRSFLMMGLEYVRGYLVGIKEIGVQYCLCAMKDLKVAE
jgi:hypothetical protein